MVMLLCHVFFLLEFTYSTAEYDRIYIFVTRFNNKLACELKQKDSVPFELSLFRSSVKLSTSNVMVTYYL